MLSTMQLVYKNKCSIHASCKYSIQSVLAVVHVVYNSIWSDKCITTRASLYSKSDEVSAEDKPKPIWELIWAIEKTIVSSNDWLLEETIHRVGMDTR